MELYERKQRANNVLKKILQQREMTKNDLLKILLENYGFSVRFLNTFAKIYEDNVLVVDGVYSWQNTIEE